MDNLYQFYTKPTVAKDCFELLADRVNIGKYAFVEPSAGDGAFYKLMPNNRRHGIDLEPKCDGVVKQDFFNYKYVGTPRVIMLGNPPFGKNSSLAVKFFNHSASMPEVDVIAFIVPKTFRKASLQNKLSMHFRLDKDVDLDDNSFMRDGKPYNVPSCFQVWKRTTNPRTPYKVDLNNPWFTFAKKKDAELAIRRVGGKTGSCTDNIETCKSHSFHFIKLINEINKDKYMNYINDLYSKKEFLKISSQSSGVRSMSSGELIDILKTKPFKMCEHCQKHIKS